jgi:hypothetical protein
MKGLCSNLILVGLLCLNSCGAVQKYSFARFSTPETNGFGLTKVQTGASQVVRLQPSPDLREERVSSEAQIDKSAATFFRPSFGLTDSFDIELNVAPQQAFESAVKWQLFGAPTSSAGAGNFSLAVRVGYSLYVTGEEIGGGESFSNPPVQRNMVINSGYTTYEAIAGYRPMANLLLFGGLFKDGGRYNLKFTEGVRDTIIHEVEASGHSFGVQWKAGNLLITFNSAIGDFEVTNRNRIEEFLHFGLALGLLF